MTLDEFEDALDQFGADLDDWPDAQANAGRALLARSPEARQALALATRLDGGLKALLATPVAAPSGLAGRILAGVEPTVAPADVVPFPVGGKAAPVAAARLPTARFWRVDRPAMIAAAMLAVCFIGGVITVQAVSPATATHESIYISAIYSDLAR